jgi:hypothetical protein
MMGVLGPEVGLHRLDEELGRRQAGGGLLGLALVGHHPLVAVDDEALDAARRAISRHVESVLGDADVVFAVDEQTLAVIMPTADWTTGLASLGRIALAASQATYADPEDRTRRAVGSTIRISTALVVADDTTAESRTLMAAAYDALLSGDGARR